MNLKDLTIEEKIGQMLMLAFHGKQMNGQINTLISEVKVGGLIHFGRNIGNLEEVFALNTAMQEKANIPLFIGLDQEGGPVLRVINGVTPILGAMSLSASATLDEVKALSKISGKELRTLGFNMNFAPVGDVNNNPHNPVINSRSYSDDPKVVGEFVKAAYQGLQESLIIPTIKHFPGHGNTSVDSHLDLPVVNDDRESLFNTEILPFKEAVEDGIDGVMLSHVLYKSLDANLPASLSKNIVRGILREELKFEGLCVTDSLTMKAISNRFTKEEVILNAVNAGIDVLIFCGEAKLEDQLEIKKVFLSLVNSGKIPVERIDESVKRILQYKEKYQISKIDHSFEQIKSGLLLPENLEFVNDLYARSTTLVKGNGLLPLEKNENVLVIFPKLNTATLTEVDSSPYGTLGKYLMCDEIIINSDSVDFNFDEINEKYEKIIICTYNVSVGDYQHQIYKKLDKDKLVVASLRSPYDLFVFDDLTNYICIYEPTKKALEYLAKALKGETQFKGTLPVKI